MTDLDMTTVLLFMIPMIRNTYERHLPQAECGYQDFIRNVPCWLRFHMQKDELITPDEIGTECRQ